jgi:hypothetical protein
MLPTDVKLGSQIKSMVVVAGAPAPAELVNTTRKPCINQSKTLR